MSNIVKFAPRRPERYCEGPAQCIACKHRWAAAAPVGVRWLECPACGTMRGTWRHAVEASPGDYEFSCNCCGGNALTAINRKGLFYLMCMGCGVDHTEAVFG